MNREALLLPMKFCLQNGCPKRTREGYCPEHKTDNATTEYNHERKKDPIDRQYGTVRWLNFRRMIITSNWLCQRLKSGLRCDRPSSVVHHLKSPRLYPDLMFVPSNVVALCPRCHPGGEVGTPDWREGKDFVKTIYKLPNFGGEYEHP
jgi:hypothetical protein